MGFTVGWHELEGVKSWTSSGDDVTFDVGTIKPPSSIATDPDRVSWAKALLLSLAGMVDEVVPIVSTEWPEVTGLYRVTASPSTHDVSLTTGVIDAGSLSTRRVSGGVARALLLVTGGARPVTAPVGAFPAGVTYGGVPGWVGVGATVDESLVDASGLTVHRVAVSTPAVTDVPAEIPVGQFYGGAARVEARVGGVWVPVHGRQIPRGSSIRVSNALVRVTLAASGAVPVDIDPLWEQWSGSAWQSVQLKLSDTSGLIAYRGLSGVEVLRNQPGRVALRVWGERVSVGGVSQPMPWRAVVSIRAGMELIEVTMETEAARWSHSSAAMAAMVSGGTEFGASVSSSPTLSIASDARTAFTAGPPSNVRAFVAGAPSRWALVRRSPTDRLPGWYRWAAPELRVVE